jgi:hypothetical protein
LNRQWNLALGLRAFCWCDCKGAVCAVPEGGPVSHPDIFFPFHLVVDVGAYASRRASMGPNQIRIRWVKR